VAVDLRTNSLLVTATALEMKLVEEIVEAIDVNPDEAGAAAGTARAATEPFLKVYELNTADAQEVAKTLGVLHPGMVVNEDGRAKRIHIWATADKHREIEEHIRQLDGATAGEMVVILPLVGLNPYDVSTTLTSLYAGARTGTPTVQVDPAGFGLIVRGSVVQISQIRSLIGQMADQGPSNSQKAARIVPVSSSGRSAFVQQAIGSLYPQVTISTTAAPRTSTSTTSAGNGFGRNGSSSSSTEDAERQERMRRFTEFRERLFGGFGSSRDGGGGPDSRGGSSNSGGGSRSRGNRN
jgi:type II secretory pathway component GspD/PulD (secretin)